MPVKKDYTFSRKMPENLAKLRNNRAFCDVILRSGLREVYAHRIILATLSNYFTVLFKYEGGFEKSAIDFDQNLISGECLENIVNYAYTGEINISEENVCDLLLAADYFDIPFIKTKCEEFLNELQKETDIINVETLSRLSWIACHFNLKTFLGPICNFISKHFAELSESHTLLAPSPHCLLTLLQEKDFTVLYNGIPADDIEFELFKLVISFINERVLTDRIIIKLLQMIHLSEITPEQFSSTVDSLDIPKKETVTRVFNFHALPLCIDKEDDVPVRSVERKYARRWKYVSGLEKSGESRIELDDRVRQIKIYTFTGIPSVKKSPDRKSNSSRPNVYKDHTSISGLSLTYISGKTMTIGDTSEEPALPFDNVCSHEFILSKDEVIVKIAKTPLSLDSIKFVTNLGNEIGPIGKKVTPLTYLQTYSSECGCGYFHSLRHNCTIDHLEFLWVEYSDPGLRQNVGPIRIIHRDTWYRPSLQSFVAVACDDSDNDIYYDDDNEYYGESDSDY